VVVGVQVTLPLDQVELVVVVTLALVPLEVLELLTQAAAVVLP
jgi:hypothetical protein